jgi:hypothetical protein
MIFLPADVRGFFFPPFFLYLSFWSFKVFPDDTSSAWWYAGGKLTTQKSAKSLFAKFLYVSARI